MFDRGTRVVLTIALASLCACGARTELDALLGPAAPDDAGATDADAASTGAAGTLVLFGGEDGTGALGDSWSFGPSGWTQLTVSAAPSARAGASAATLGDALVLFGGFTISTGAVSSSVVDLGDTWTFDGVRWAQVAVPVGPGARHRASMAALGNEVVLFGGQTAGRFLGDTWMFDGSRWHEVRVPTAPPARAGAAMATLGKNVVLFGGATAMRTLMPDGVLNDTWSFDGMTWVEVAAAAPHLTAPPLARSDATMTAFARGVVLFGGSGDPLNSGGDLDDTWTLAATSWSLVSNPTYPLRRERAAMGTLGNQAVLFGGSAQRPAGGSSFVDDTWEFDGTSWSRFTGSAHPSARASASLAWVP